MKKILIPLLFLVLIFNYSSAFSSSDSSALILLDSTHTTIEQNYRTVEEHYQRIKILNTRGREVFGDIKKRFNAEKQKFEIIQAHTITPGGKIVKPVKSGISIVSAPEVGYASQYTNMQMQVVSFPALEPGAVIEYKYKISDIESSEQLPSGKIVWQGTHPIRKKIFNLTIPEIEKDKVRFLFHKYKAEPKITVKEGKITYSYEIKNIERIKNENHRPSNLEISPILYYSFNKSWLDVLKPYKEKFYQAVNIMGNLENEYSSIFAKQNPEVEEIVNYVKQDIRNVELFFYNGISEPNSAAQVLKNKYGTPQDKAVLLVSLLKSQGIEAYPVLFANRNIDDLSKELPMLDLFSYIIVAVPFEDKMYYVSPSEQFCRYNWLPYKFQDRQAVALQAEENNFFHLPYSEAKQSQSNTFLQAMIDKDGKLTGVVKMEAGGYYDQKMREALKFKNQHLQEMFFTNFVNSIRSGAKLKDFSFTNPEFLQKNMIINVEFEIANYVTIQGNRKKISVPKPTISSAEVQNYTSSNSREYSLCIGPPRTISYNLNLELPTDYKVNYLPAAKFNFEDFADFNLKVEHDNNNFEFNMNYHYYKTLVPAEKYHDFKQFQSSYFNQNNWLMLFK